jgi:hypothetical protein
MDSGITICPLDDMRVVARLSINSSFVLPVRLLDHEYLFRIKTAQGIYYSVKGKDFDVFGSSPQ